MKDTKINGDLLIASTVADRNINLDNVTVTGKIYIEGAGSHSVHFNNMTAESVIVGKLLGEKPRLVTDKNAIISNIVISNNTIVDETTATKTGSIEIGEKTSVNLFGNYNSVKVDGQESTINTYACTISSLSVSQTALHTKISVDNDTNISMLFANNSAIIAGKGSVNILNI